MKKIITIVGSYNSTKFFVSELEPPAEEQIRALCKQPFAEDGKIRIMPAAQAGKECTIGTTMTISDYVVPNLVGVDIR